MVCHCPTDDVNTGRPTNRRGFSVRRVSDDGRFRAILFGLFGEHEMFDYNGSRARPCKLNTAVQVGVFFFPFNSNIEQWTIFLSLSLSLTPPPLTLIIIGRSVSIVMNPFWQMVIFSLT